MHSEIHAAPELFDLEDTHNIARLLLREGPTGVDPEIRARPGRSDKPRVSWLKASRPRVPGRCRECPGRYHPLLRNWWAAADGPSGAGRGSGDTVTLNVLFSPFRTTAPDGC